MNAISQAIGKYLASYLTKTLPGYQRIDTVSIAEVAAVLQTGDILLVDGNTRISTAIKYLTQSSWSHACLYMGSGAEETDVTNLLEASLKGGVRVVSLNYYADFNLRICRPVNLSEDDIDRLIGFAKAKLGHQYDLKNVFDLIRYLIQKPAVPNRYRRAMIGLGSGEERELDQIKDSGGRVPHYYKRHFTHFTPRDFDLSPYFMVVKPTIEKGFDHRQLNWL